MKRTHNVIRATMMIASLSVVFLLLAFILSVENPTIPARISYASHAPILINGNAGFLGSNATTGISRGSGTAFDPYVIKGWVINASDQGIIIMNTNAHFVIRDCYVHMGTVGTPYWLGIYLFNCVNGTVTGNICSDNYRGIYLYLSSHNTIGNNICNSNKAEGIILQGSSYNTLDNNSCSHNWCCICLMYSSNNNTVSNNNCSNNSNGIRIFSSLPSEPNNNNLISGNLVCNNTGYGVYIGDRSGCGFNNRIWDNTFIGNNGAGSVRDPAHLQAYDIGTNDWWNTSGSPHGYGNYWGDWTTTDVNSDGIVDKPYNLTAGVGPMDYYPLTTAFPPIPEFSEFIIPTVGLILIALIIGRVRIKP